MAIKGTLALLLFSLNSLFWCSLLLIAAAFKALLPDSWRGGYVARLHPLVDAWVDGNTRIVKALRLIDMRVHAPAELHRDRWYLVLSNHQSWTDIVVLQCALKPHMPVLKFFMKRELIWVPLIGLSCWVLDFPFMRRYSAEVLKRHPELRHHDRDETKRACARFARVPTAILNFVEGTRFTPEKHAHQQSPFTRLLRPKTGGVAQVVHEMHGTLHSVADVTLIYSGPAPDFWNFLCGTCARVDVHIVERAIPTDMVHGDYDDQAHRDYWRNWLDGVWAEKDALLGRAAMNGQR